ncbi:MAG: hypothetical protein LBO09_00765 [Candidatus Peribacteria bacterium]|jgi:uncharacterized metal-binding protein YceD (DUF177 family)|nr:hypothetical protein [Candidatus Peribacteria bacterium]
MKGNSFEIKVADLLNHLGNDTLEFSEVQTSLLPSLTDKGLKGTLYLYSVDGKSVLVRMENLEGALQEVCENCGETFLRPIHVEEYTAKFTIDPASEEDSDEEAILPIDKKNATINIEELLYQAVKLQEPFVIKCEACEKLFPELDETDLQ